MWRGWILTRVCGKVVDVGKDREFDKFEFCGGIRNEINISQTDLGMEGKGIRL